MGLKTGHTARNGILAGLAALFLLVFTGPLLELMKYSLHPDHSRYNSHIVFIPFVSAYLLFLKRKQISEHRDFSISYGIPVIGAGILLFVAGIRAESFLSETDFIFLRTFSIVACWIGGFILFFGPHSFRVALFPLLFLLFLAPVPTVLMGEAFLFLQAASSEVSYLLFQLAGVPIAREGFTFHLPGLSILIAPECSGMRAAISLFIVSVLASHLFLRSVWHKIVAVSSVLPITILGNGTRIVALTLMALYVNPNFMKSKALLHERGGWALFLVDLILFGCVIAFLRKGEKIPGDFLKLKR